MAGFTPIPIRSELIIFISYNITIIVSPLFRAFPLPFFRGHEPSCSRPLNAAPSLVSSTRQHGHVPTKNAHGTFVFPLRVMASAPPIPTESPDPTLDVSSPTAIYSRQHGGMIVCCNNPRGHRGQATTYANGRRFGSCICCWCNNSGSFSSLLTPQLEEARGPQNALRRFPSGKYFSNPV